MTASQRRVFLFLGEHDWNTPSQNKPSHLHGEGPQDDGAEDGVGEDAVKDVSLSVNLASVDLVEELHQDEGVEDDGVVLRGRRVKRSVAATVDVEHALAWKAEEEGRKR